MWARDMISSIVRALIISRSRRYLYRNPGVHACTCTVVQSTEYILKPHSRYLSGDDADVDVCGRSISEAE